MNAGRAGRVHSRALRPAVAATGTVDAETGPELRRRPISPGSTDPMTTTCMYSREIPNTKQAPGGARLLTCQLILPTGGSFL
jgi:hypothetical protein